MISNLFRSFIALEKTRRESRRAAPIALWWGKAAAQRVINFVKLTIRLTKTRIRTEPLLFSCLPRSRNIFSSFFLFDLFIGHLMGFDDFPVPFRIELQCEKKMRRYGRFTHHHVRISIKDCGVGVSPLTHFVGVPK